MISYPTESVHRTVGQRRTTVLWDESGRDLVVTCQTGELMCTIDNKVWCNHIQTVIKASLDSEAMFSDQWMHQIYKAVVPIFPTQYAIYADVKMELVGPTDEMARAHVWSDGATKSIRVDACSLGIVALGDGRMQLRRMVLDWLRSSSIDNGAGLPACEGMTHSWKRVVEVNKDWGGDREEIKLAHTWCLLWYGKCYRCLAEEGAVVTFPGDLVPPRA